MIRFGRRLHARLDLDRFAKGTSFPLECWRGPLGHVYNCPSDLLMFDFPDGVAGRERNVISATVEQRTALPRRKGQVEIVVQESRDDSC